MFNARKDFIKNILLEKLKPCPVTKRLCPWHNGSLCFYSQNDLCGVELSYMFDDTDTMSCIGCCPKGLEVGG